jgi:histidine triad (HIT) family protein
MEDCIFCRIGRGEIPACVVWQDDEFVAFDDIAPQAPVHVLIIPRAHYEHVGDDVPAEVLGRLCSVVPKVAALKGVAESGYRTIMNTGPDAGQTVPHLHVHVLGGMRMGEGMVRREGA